MVLAVVIEADLQRVNESMAHREVHIRYFYNLRSSIPQVTAEYM